MKNLSVLLVLVFISFGAFAQKNKMKDEKIDHEAHAMLYADKMTTKFGLDADKKEAIQKAQFKRLEAEKELKDEYANEMMGEDAEDMADEKADMQKQRMKIQTDFKEEMKEILSTSQYQKWEVMHQREMKMHDKEMMMHDKNMKMKDKDWKEKGMKKDKSKEKEDQNDDN